MKLDFINKIGKGIKSGTQAVGHLLSEPEHKIEGAINSVYNDGKHAIGSVYKDGRSAVSFTGSHLVNDVDNLSSMLSNPLLIIGVIIVAGVVVSKL